jgi:hypothetical protein
MEGYQRCLVRVAIHGETESVNFRLRHGTNVASVLATLRETFGVVNGTLSYDNNDWEVVDVLEADQVYYFVGFSAPQGTQAPPPAGEHSSRDDARL